MIHSKANKCLYGFLYLLFSISMSTFPLKSSWNFIMVNQNIRRDIFVLPPFLLHTTQIWVYILYRQSASWVPLKWSKKHQGQEGARRMCFKAPCNCIHKHMTNTSGSQKKGPPKQSILLFYLSRLAGPWMGNWSSFSLFQSFYTFRLRLLPLTHFAETPEAEISFSLIFWHN